MTRRILVDGSIAIEPSGELSASGVSIERYDGQGDDHQLIIEATERHALAVVVAGDAFLVAYELMEEAERRNVTLVVTHTANPLDAAGLVGDHADDIVAYQRGATVRLLADGLRAVG
jgi:hypothetical protein